jgi:hypothetical protein
VVPDEPLDAGRRGGFDVRRQPRCYNYGTTDFGSPPAELGLRFLRGTARFWVSEWSLERMLDAYRAADRSVYRQRLHLDSAALERALQRLEHDAREENRYYAYHHFDDNCSTRLRDLLDSATNGRLRAVGREVWPVSYRELGARALAGEPGLVLIGDLLVGRRADRRPTEYAAAFLPAVLQGLVEQGLGAEPELVYRRRGAPLGGEAPRTEGYWLSIALGLSVLLGAAVALGQSRLGLAIVGAALGFVGIAVWGVAALSSVRELRVNEALLVFLPSDLVLGWLSARGASWYARFRLAGLAAVSLLHALGVLMQPLYAVLLVPALGLGWVALGLSLPGSRRAAARERPA